MTNIELHHYYKKPLKVKKLIITNFEDSINLEMVITKTHSIIMPRLFFGPQSHVPDKKVSP